MSIRSDLVRIATEEWELFGKDEGRGDKFIDRNGNTTSSRGSSATPNRRKETVEPFASRVGDHWLAIPGDQYDNLVKKFAKPLGKLDGTVDLPWSAAFISYCMQKAGAGPDFPYASGHAAWITKSVANRKANKLKAPLVGFRPGEEEMRPGDLIARPREPSITYDNAVAKGFFISHSDIVVDIDKANGVARVIGGNVGQSISLAEVAMTGDGKLKAEDGWFVHICNNIAAKAVAVTAVTPKKLAAARVG